MSSRTEIKSVQEMLKSRLAPADFKRFQAKDIESLQEACPKTFCRHSSFGAGYQGDASRPPPGDPLPGLLIKSLLETFNPSALHKGKMFDLKAFCSCFHQLHMWHAFLASEADRAALLSEEAKQKVRNNSFLDLRDGTEVGGGFFYAPGKAVTALHNLKPLQRWL